MLEEGQFVLISNGSGSFWSEPTGELAIRAGTAFVVFPGVAHSYRPAKRTGWHEHWVGIIGPIADRFWDDLFSPAQPLIYVGEDSRLVSAFRNVCELVEYLHQGSQGLLAAKSMEIASMLFQKTLPQRRHEDEHAIGKACMMMVESLHQPIDFKQFAASVAMSYSVFRRRFKDHTGMAPNQYLLQLRLEKASRLLKNTTLSVERISELVGFTSVSYFSRFFKEHTGVSPLRFRSLSHPLSAVDDE
ncbi:HTH-type transcriptional activator RhaR [Neorhodopirellula pilleata]|uniref:HTH-type transcriptional activator RhaR n=2 Tax=Neorhodopirellula pilleata TaxID=2714738 RepID=A0A5C6ATP6_9BACT|nr:HTH-type transcriptional activator RhaR [Neorhodopirellula pilleata]